MSEPRTELGRQLILDMGIPPKSERGQRLGRRLVAIEDAAGTVERKRLRASLVTLRAMGAWADDGASIGDPYDAGYDGAIRDVLRLLTAEPERQP